MNLFVSLPRPYVSLLLLAGLVLFTPMRSLAQVPVDSTPIAGLIEPPPYIVGQTLDIFAAFRFNGASGGADTFDPVLTVTVSPGITFVSVTAVHPIQPFDCILNSPHEIVCTRDVIRGSSEIEATMRFDAPGDHTISITTSQSNPEINPDDNTIAGIITVEGGAPQTGALSGIKWHDQDQDGEQDGGEPGLSGWTIFVDENGNGTLDGGEPSATTGAGGGYQIDDLDPGTYTVREVVQDGWQQTFPAGGAHTVTVQANQTTEGVNFGNVQPVVEAEADLSVEKTVAPTQAFVGDALTYTISVTNGGPDEAPGVFIEDIVFKDSLQVMLASLPAGCVRVEDIDDDTGLPVWVVECRPGTLAVGASVTVSYQATALAAGTVSNEVEVSSEVTDPNLSNNIAIAQAAVLSTSISGTKYHDQNANGIREADEPGLAGWTIYLDQNGNDLLDPGEPSTVTGADGSYEIGGLVPNGYRVREVVQDGWKQSAPVFQTGFDYHEVVVGLGQQLDGVDFGNYEPATTIFGYKGYGDGEFILARIGNWKIYLDLNKNGTLDADEPVTVTDNRGNYAFSNLPPGSYIVREEERAGWSSVSPSSDAALNFHQVALDGEGSERVADFSNIIDGDPRINKEITAQDEARVTFLITVENPHTTAITAVVLDPLSSRLLFIGATPSQGTCDFDGLSGLTCDLGTLAGATSATIELTTEIREPPTVENPICNSALLQAGIEDLFFAYPEDREDGRFLAMTQEVCLRVPGTSDLSVRKTVEADTVALGDVVSYIVSISNLGPDDALNVRLADFVFADSLEFVPASLSSSCVLQQSDLLNCTIPVLEAGAMLSFRYQARTKLTGTVTNSAIVSSGGTDPNSENDTAQARAYVIVGTDLSIEKTVETGPGPVIVGDTLRYTVTLTNNGPARADVASFTDDAFINSLEFLLPAPGSLDGLICSTSTFSSLNSFELLNSLGCTTTALEVEESRSVSYRAVAKRAGMISNMVEIFNSDPPDFNPANNTATVITVVEAETTTDYTLDASASTNTAKAGDEVTFTFSLSSDGATESGRLTITASDDWSDPKPGDSFVVVDGDTMIVVLEDLKVEDSPDGFPEGTTRITYFYSDGFSDGQQYNGSLTLKAGQSSTAAAKAQDAAVVRFEAFVPGNDDPNPADDIVEVFVDIEDTGTAIEPDPVNEIPQVFRLHANYPNPFNPETTIRFDIKERARVRLQVFNLLGQAVETLVDEVLAPGRYEAVFDARDLPSGSYFYRLEAGAFSQTRPMVLLK